MTASEPSSSRPSIQQTRQLYLVCLVEMGAGFFLEKGIVVISHHFRPNTKVLSLLSETKTEYKQSFRLPFYLCLRLGMAVLNPT